MLTNLLLALVKSRNHFMEGRATLVEFSIQMLSRMQMFLAPLGTLQGLVLFWETLMSCLMNQAKARLRLPFSHSEAIKRKVEIGGERKSMTKQDWGRNYSQ